MKLKYEDFAFKTNRNALVRKKFDVGVTVPENIKNKMKKIEIVKINLPDKFQRSPSAHLKTIGYFTYRMMNFRV